MFRVYYGTAIEDLIRDIKDETGKLKRIEIICKIAKYVTEYP